MSALDQYYRTNLINENSSNLEVDRYTRCVTLMIIRGCMLPDSNGFSVNLMYLCLLRDINHVSKYTWGSVVLEFLNRELYTTSTIGNGEIVGLIFILQVLASSRITFLCPDPFGDINDDGEHDDQILLFPPFGERYIYKFLCKCFKWVSYSNEFDKENCHSVCPLICLNIVERHSPDRVLLRFGQLQHIPRTMFDGDEFHECTRQG
ncbi:serine/threonine-protein phosphatase 7 long form homolog [Primulina eburnea]|uniref:serine/threonine-protein phosphatase 7 long form homolog n=1 Tax=Primulina eburnea TaxID=1245227 RepID=UPI003C6BD968